MAKLLVPYLFKWQDVEAKSDLERGVNENRARIVRKKISNDWRVELIQAPLPSFKK